MKQPLISVVMPTYNGRQYIEMAIDSILSQTYQNFEFIIVDGHSTDGTAELLEKYTQKDRRIIVIPDEKKGIGAALRLGCSLAKGQYIARMDADDIALPQRLEQELDYLRNHNRVVLVSCSAIYIDEYGQELGYSFPYTWQYWLRRHVRSVLHPGVLMCKDAYLKAGEYPCLKRVEDNLLWKRMKKTGLVHIIEYPLMKYRVVSDSLTNSMDSSFWMDFEIYIQHFVEKEILTTSDYEQINAFIDKYIMRDNLIPVRNNINLIELKLLTLLRKIFSDLVSFKIIFLLKNIYGLFKIKKL